MAQTSARPAPHQEILDTDGTDAEIDLEELDDRLTQLSEQLLELAASKDNIQQFKIVIYLDSLQAPLCFSKIFLFFVSCPFAPSMESMEGYFTT